LPKLPQYRRWRRSWSRRPKIPVIFKKENGDNPYMTIWYYMYIQYIYIWYVICNYIYIIIYVYIIYKYVIILLYYIYIQKQIWYNPVEWGIFKTQPKYCNGIVIQWAPSGVIMACWHIPQRSSE
jgi:hypothetical protein